MNFYSQQGEDFFLFITLANRFRLDGVIVEIGAFDGLTYSNSKFFEDTLGYRSLLIEPAEKSFQKLLKNRPNSICVNVAIGNVTGHKEFLGENAIAGLVDALPEMYITDLKAKGHTSTLCKVMVFDELIYQYGLDHIDILSIDVEGAELEVLKGISTEFMASSVSIVVIELDSINPRKDLMCRLILEQAGFNRIFQLGINDFFVNPHSQRLRKLRKISDKLHDPREILANSKFFSLERNSASEIIAKCLSFYERNLSKWS